MLGLVKEGVKYGNKNMIIVFVFIGHILFLGAFYTCRGPVYFQSSLYMKND